KDQIAKKKNKIENLTEFGLANDMIIESDEDNSDNYEDQDEIENNDSIKYEVDSEYESNLLITNFSIHVESDPNDISYLLLTMDYFATFPKSNYHVSKLFGLDKNFIKFYVCPKYPKLFWTQEYLSEICQSNCICEAKLKKPVCISKEKILYKAIKTYPYYSIILYLKKILLLPEIEEVLESFGLIPEPHKPSITELIVYELDKLWSGVIINLQNMVNFFVFLILPSGKVNFSEFNQEFSHLNNVEHKQLFNNWLNANNREKKQIFDKYEI
ncbi:16639_t:CDS:2, partial [Dentiscutata erythropus]